jgi:hypothetical protein
MLTIVEAQRRSDLFLTGQMREALRAVEYESPSFDAEPHEMELAAAARARVDIRHVRGASDATYLIHAFGDELLMQLQLNVHRFVVVYRVPALEALDASTLSVRLDRWRIGAEHAGWKFGWRDAPLPLAPREFQPHGIADRTGTSNGSRESTNWDYSRRYIETYCYAFANPDFLENEAQQLYWRTDIVQMTRYFMLEAARCGVQLSPRRAGFPV